MEIVTYKLKETKKGKIQKSNFNFDDFKKILLSSSILLVSTALIYGAHNVKENRETDAKINEAVVSIEPSSTYISEIEDMLNIDIDDKYEHKISELSSSLDLINSYRDTTDPLKKSEYKNKLLDNYEEVKSVSLNLLKEKIASENRTTVDNIKLRSSKGKVSINIIGVGDIELHGDDLRLGDSIANFYGYNVDSVREDGKDDVMSIYVKQMENVITDSVKLVNGKKDYKLPDIAKVVR